MVKESKDKPLTIIQRHEYLNMFKIKGGQRTNLNNLKRRFELYAHKNLAYNTARNYSSIINRLLVSVNFDTPRISIKMLLDFLEGHNHGVVVQSAIKTFLKFLQKEYNKKFIDFDYPTKLKSEEKVIVTITEEQINKIIKQLPEEFKFLCKFQFMCGLRIAEPFFLYLNQFDWNEWKTDKKRNRSVIIKKTKSRRERKIPINGNFMQEIFNYAEANSIDKLVRSTNLLFDFGWEPYLEKRMKKAKTQSFVPLIETWNGNEELKDHLRQLIRIKFVQTHTRAFSREFSKASRKALGESYTPHILRKSRATQLLKAGVPLLEVSKFLGHRKIETTQKYLSSDFEDLNKSMSRLGL